MMFDNFTHFVVVGGDTLQPTKPTQTKTPPPPTKNKKQKQTWLNWWLTTAEGLYL
jgi:hypothetical protein